MLSVAVSGGLVTERSRKVRGPCPPCLGCGDHPGRPCRVLLSVNRRWHLQLGMRSPEPSAGCKRGGPQAWAPWATCPPHPGVALGTHPDRGNSGQRHHRCPLVSRPWVPMPCQPVDGHLASLLSKQQTEPGPWHTCARVVFPAPLCCRPLPLVPPGSPLSRLRGPSQVGLVSPREKGLCFLEREVCFRPGFLTPFNFCFAFVRCFNYQSRACPSWQVELRNENVSPPSQPPEVRC